jgi:hypothetical protein
MSYDLYATEQYTVGVNNFQQPNVRHYEDNLRYEQYGIPMNSRCANPNPYIADDIRKSQRHAPIRAQPIESRAEVIAATSCEPGLYGQDCTYASGQRVRKVDGECPTNLNLKCRKPKHAGLVLPGGTEIDMNLVLFVFIFLVLIYLCMNSISAKKDIAAVTGGFMSLRDSILMKS